MIKLSSTNLVSHKLYSNDRKSTNHWRWHISQTTSKELKWDEIEHKYIQWNRKHNDWLNIFLKINNEKRKSLNEQYLELSWETNKWIYMRFFINTLELKPELRPLECFIIYNSKTFMSILVPDFFISPIVSLSKKWANCYTESNPWTSKL